MWSALICSTLVLAACNPHFGTSSGPVQHATISTKYGEVFTFSGDRDTVLAASPSTNTFTNTREFFWNENGPFLADQQACITWVTPSGQSGDSMQPGLAMRIAPSGPDGESVKGISVHQNIWAGVTWIFWINLWDSSDPSSPFIGHENFDLSPIIDELQYVDGMPVAVRRPGPWHVCARTRGTLFTFKLWIGDDPEPAWDDPDHAFSTVLPESWNYPGYSGGYVGHVRAGETAIFAGQSSSPSCLQPDLIDTVYCQEQIAHIRGPSTTTTSVAAPSTSTPSTATPPTTTAPASPLALTTGVSGHDGIGEKNALTAHGLGG